MQEQRVAITFSVKAGKSAVETIELINKCTRIGQILCGFEFSCIYMWLRHFA